MTRNLLSAPGALVVALTFASGAAAQTTSYVRITMVTGATQLIAHVSNVNPDCTSRGDTEVRIMTEPTSGALRMAKQLGYGHFTGDYEQCSTRKVAGVSVYYTPQKGFIGSDSVQLDVFFPNGVERIENYAITVK
ncbi:MAG: hypothetical protein E7774_08385 [Bradyrhizobium sp.]|nr:MAG: hypothetical protein E7774_08385 [Bradyrhizobium sp.]